MLNEDLQKKLKTKILKAEKLVKDIYFDNQNNCFRLKGKDYGFDENKCTCMDKTFHCIKNGLPCKHNIATEKWLLINPDPRNNIIKNDDKFKELKEYCHKNEDFVLKTLLYEKFDWLVDDALQQGLLKDSGSYFVFIY